MGVRENRRMRQTKKEVRRSDREERNKLKTSIIEINLCEEDGVLSDEISHVKGPKIYKCPSPAVVETG